VGVNVTLKRTWHVRFSVTFTPTYDYDIDLILITTCIKNVIHYYSTQNIYLFKITRRPMFTDMKRCHGYSVIKVLKQWRWRLIPTNITLSVSLLRIHYWLWMCSWCHFTVGRF